MNLSEKEAITRTKEQLSIGDSFADERIVGSTREERKESLIRIISAQEENLHQYQC
jgi:hypothetical protein